MEQALQAVSQMSVAQKVAVTGALAVLVLVAAVASTAALLSWRVALMLWAGGALLGAAALPFLPLGLRDLNPRPAPSADFAAALARLEAENAQDPTLLNALCPSRLLDHGGRTPKAVVLLHGISSCPRAFVDFAPLVHARGHNVLVLRMPRNGYADRATDALGRLTAEELRDWADAAVDIAAGLGEDVVVLGISAGGTAAAWAAVNRPEVSRAVIVAPFFGLAGFSPRVNRGLMRAMLVLPNLSMWKDPILRARFHGMAHAYARQATRGTGEVMRLGAAVFAALAAAPPKGGSAVVVTNAGDRAIQNQLADAFAASWDPWGAQLASHVFPASDGLGHEIIDPDEPGADPALTYPVLLRMIDAPWSALKRDPAGRSRRRILPTLRRTRTRKPPGGGRTANFLLAPSSEALDTTHRSTTEVESNAVAVHNQASGAETGALAGSAASIGRTASLLPKNAAQQAFIRSPGDQLATTRLGHQ